MIPDQILEHPDQGSGPERFTERLVVLIPRSWKRELEQIAARNGQALGAISRMALRDFLIERAG